ncbi:Hypothetical protein ORPV_1190 [Orpheovirus IHUMI-LCC2]|uniref:Uncharacterized protein n=1 Tax=Orpheovirus IHUMI-LCC2 TaxID=2023057 RepID=A0A2I2L6D4_9VIRU|nr:Hypothetical protein ORPV_1190 [Orpheovirus IHUMI-LCC2]SNW63094.1 Hypothetical protein ORPV_1190 [Orpheovirus IHUMI-LCC2]
METMVHNYSIEYSLNKNKIIGKKYGKVDLLEWKVKISQRPISGSINLNVLIHNLIKFVNNDAFKEKYEEWIKERKPSHIVNIGSDVDGMSTVKIDRKWKESNIMFYIQYLLGYDTDRFVSPKYHISDINKFILEAHGIYYIKFIYNNIKNNKSRRYIVYLDDNRIYLISYDRKNGYSMIVEDIIRDNVNIDIFNMVNYEIIKCLVCNIY